MSFKEKGFVTVKDINGKKVEEIQSETIITVTNKAVSYTHLTLPTILRV